MPDIDAVLKDIEALKGTEYLPILGEELGAHVEWLVREARPMLAVEVGALVGYMTIRIARNLSKGGKVISLEIAEDLAHRAKENVARAGLSGNTEIRVGDAREGLSDVPDKIDFVLLDAERSQYLNHLKKLESKLSPGAIVVAVGTGKDARALASYLAYVRKDVRYQSEQKTFGDDAIEVSTFLG